MCPGGGAERNAKSLSGKNPRSTRTTVRKITDFSIKTMKAKRIEWHL